MQTLRLWEARSPAAIYYDDFFETDGSDDTLMQLVPPHERPRSNKKDL